MNTHILKRANFAAIVAVTAAVMFATSTMATAFQVPLGGETITVTTCNDVSDFSGTQQVSDLPGPDGRVSFREAVTAANNTPGPQTIAFAIPVAEFWLVTDVALLKLEEDAFFLTDSGTTIDFSTQTTNIGDTNPNGPEVGIYGLQPNGWGIAAIFINGNNCVIKGLGKVYQRGYAVRARRQQQPRDRLPDQRSSRLLSRATWVGPPLRATSWAGQRRERATPSPDCVSPAPLRATS